MLPETACHPAALPRQGGHSLAPLQPPLHAAAQQEQGLPRSPCETLTLLALASTQEQATPLPANSRGWRKLVKGKTPSLWMQSKAGQAIPGTQQPVWMGSCRPHPGRCRQGGLHHHVPKIAAVLPFHSQPAAMPSSSLQRQAALCFQSWLQRLQIPAGAVQGDQTMKSRDRATL